MIYYKYSTYKIITGTGNFIKSNINNSYSIMKFLN